MSGGMTGEQRWGRMDGGREGGRRAEGEKGEEVETSDGLRKEADGWRSKGGGGGTMGDGGERDGWVRGDAEPKVRGR